MAKAQVPQPSHAQKREDINQTSSCEDGGGVINCNPPPLLLQILANQTYIKAILPVSHAMQAQYRRRRPVQLAADVIENSMQGQKLTQPKHDLDKSLFSWIAIWALKNLAEVMICMAASVSLFCVLSCIMVRHVLKNHAESSTRQFSGVGVGIKTKIA